MRNIVFADRVKRTFAALIDALIAGALLVGLFALAQWLYLRNDYSDNLKATLLGYQTDSGLYYEKDGNALAYEYASYDSYEETVHGYYTTYLVSGCPEASRSSVYTDYWFNVHILGLADSEGLYSATDLSSIEEPSKTTGSALFEYQSDVELLAVPKATLYAEGQLTEKAQTDLLAFFYSASVQSVYYNAAKNLQSQPFFQTSLIAYTSQSNTYPLLTVAPIATLLVYLLVPLLFKDGETLGKKMLGIGLVNRLGFRVSKPQIVLRQLPTLALIEILFVFISQYLVIMLFLGLLLVSYLFVLFDPKSRALHDRWSGTIAIDLQKSIFYANAKEEEAGEATYRKAVAEAEKLKSDGEIKVAEEQKVSGE